MAKRSEEVKPCFGTFAGLRACAGCRFRASCRFMTESKNPDTRLGFVSGDSYDWKYDDLYPDEALRIPEEIFYDDPPANDYETFGAGEILRFLEMLDRLNPYALYILREVVLHNGSITVSELAARRGVSRQAMDGKIGAICHRHEWCTPMLYLVRVKTGGRCSDMKMMRIIQKLKSQQKKEVNEQNVCQS